jgi:hypothetical protein
MPSTPATLQLRRSGSSRWACFDDAARILPLATTADINACCMAFHFWPLMCIMRYLQANT